MNNYFVISKCQALYVRVLYENFRDKILRDFCVIHKTLDHENLELYGTSTTVWSFAKLFDIYNNYGEFELVIKHSADYVCMLTRSHRKMANRHL